ncbi:ABC-type branched-subunit amino acid transport system substrate-binding protein (plasmid) [Ensifer sp. WSM1721]
MKKRAIAAIAIAVALSAGLPSMSWADTIKIANVIELSGAGATVGSNWRDALKLAFEEINAAGGNRSR